MIREYFDQVRVTLINVLNTLQFNGDDVLTTTETKGRGLQIKEVADPTDAQDVVTKKYLEDNGSGGVATVNDGGPDGAGNVNVTLDSVAKKGDTSTVAMKVPAVVYGAGWANNPSVPTRGDVYTEMEKKASSAPSGAIQTITLPSAATVQARIDGATSGVDYPTGWVLSVGASSKDLLVTHNLNTRVAYVTVWAVNGTEEQQLFDTVAYNGIRTPDVNSLLVQSLATIQKEIKIYISVL